MGAIVHLVYVLSLPPGYGTSFAFSPDGTVFVVGLDDGRIEYWALTVR